MTDAEVEAAARAMWDVFKTCEKRDETWGEMIAQGHQGSKRVAEFREYARAALAATEGAAIPDGWVLVPREATLELEMYRDARMYDALMGGAVFKGWNRSALDRARRVTEAAMLAARPAPEQTP